MKGFAVFLKLSAIKLLVAIAVLCLFVPEILTAASYVRPEKFKWWRRLVEDSDETPNHKDGIFIVTVWGAIWSLRAALWCTYKENEVMTGEWIVAFLTLLGIRANVTSKAGIITSLTERITQKEITSTDNTKS